MTYYIFDPTLGSKPVSPIYFDDINALVLHLEGTCKRLFGKTRTAYMRNLEELGHSSDEPTGRNFVQAMYDTIEIGLVKNDRLLRCNIFEATHYSKYKTEMGD